MLIKHKVLFLFEEEESILAVESSSLEMSRNDNGF
jgi:hypothetical protein